MKLPAVSRLPSYWPYAALALIVLALLAAILILNGGHFVYTLDDAYIHLAFSEQLGQGHFGLVPGEPASPSSSILYPLLLLPLTGTALHEFHPLAWNLVALFATLFLWLRLLRNFTLETHQILASVLAVFALLALNQAGLVFSGMEASLQIACSLAVTVGLIEFLFAGRLRWWLIAGIVLGPLLRYESLTVSLPALAILTGYGRWRIAALCLAFVAAVLGGYALYSASLGLPMVPGSLLVKTSFDDPALDLWSGMTGAIEHLYRSIVGWRRDLPVLLLIGLLAIDFFHRRQGRERLLVGFALLVLLAQFAFGGHGSLGRYDAHAWSCGLAVAAFVHRDLLRRLAARGNAAAGGIAAVVLICLSPYTTAMAATTPLAANNIYAQQFQMRRFLVDFVKAKALVNDAGLTAYRNPYGIVDIVGLGSEKIRRLRRDGKLDRDAIRQLTDDVVVAVFYYDWLPVRPAWWPVAMLNLPGFRISVAERTVVIYVLHAPDGTRVHDAVERFKATLPAGISISPIAPA